MLRTVSKQREMPCSWGSPREAPESVSEQIEKGELWPRPFVVSTERNWQGRVRRLEATSLNNFSGLWGTEAVLIVYFLLLPAVELLERWEIACNLRALKGGDWPVALEGLVCH